MVPSEEHIKTSEEIEKEASQCPTLTFADILRALKSHPEWLMELRKLILTEELLELPRKFEELIKRVDKIEKDVEVLKQDVAVLKQDVAALKQDVVILKGEVAYLKGEVVYFKGEFGRFKEREFERTIRERYYAYFGRILRRSRRIELESILPQIEDLLDGGVITEAQYESILRLDLIVEGEIRKTKKPVALAVENSYSLYEEDLEKAAERADILATVLKKEVIPAVVGV